MAKQDYEFTFTWSGKACTLNLIRCYLLQVTQVTSVLKGYREMKLVKTTLKLKEGHKMLLALNILMWGIITKEFSDRVQQMF